MYLIGTIGFFFSLVNIVCLSEPILDIPKDVLSEDKKIKSTGQHLKSNYNDKSDGDDKLEKTELYGTLETMTIQLENLENTKKKLQQYITEEREQFKQRMILLLEDDTLVQGLYDTFLILATFREILAAASETDVQQVLRDQIKHSTEMSFVSCPQNTTLYNRNSKFNFSDCKVEPINSKTYIFEKTPNLNTLYFGGAIEPLEEKVLATEEETVSKSSQRRRLNVMQSFSYRLADAFDTLVYGQPTIIGRFLHNRRGPIENIFRGRSLF